MARVHNHKHRAAPELRRTRIGMCGTQMLTFTLTNLANVPEDTDVHEASRGEDN